ncbi:hypothetical protein EJB05_46192, partial [Eragrostis curvula]
MGSSGAGRRDPAENPAVGRLRELFTGDAAGEVVVIRVSLAHSLVMVDGWEKSWEVGVTPWDLGKPTPVIEHLVRSGTLPKGRVLVPGCGMGYDVVALASPERYVVGLDISDIAVKKAKEWSSSLPNADYFTFIVEDFFKWTPSEQFELIFDYTHEGGWVFLASVLCVRISYAALKQISDQDGGPPYNNTVADYQKVLEPLGFKAVLMEDNELAIKPRKGYEKLGRWKRCGHKSSL